MLGVSTGGAAPLVELDLYSIRTHELSEEKVKVKKTRTFIELQKVQFVTKTTNKATNILKKDRTLEIQNTAANRAWKNVRSILFGNFHYRAKLVTLTFKDTDKFDINSLEECNRRKERYILKLRKEFPKLKYIIVPEYQKRGAVHFHMVCNISFIDLKKFKSLWVYGFSSIVTIKDPTIQLPYIAKYITKNPEQHIKGTRRYYCSNNVEKPQVLTPLQAQKAIELLKKLGDKPLVTYSYDSEYHGKVTYSSYLLPKKFKDYYKPN